MKSGNIWRVGAVAALALILTGCKWVSIHVEDGDDNIRMAVPFFLFKKAVQLSDQGHFRIDDLGGVNQDIDLRKVAKALREDGSRFKLEYREADSLVRGVKHGDVFRLTVDEDSGEQVTVNFPMALIDILAEDEDGVITTREAMRAFRRYRGVLVEVRDGSEHVRIALR